MLKRDQRLAITARAARALAIDALGEKGLHRYFRAPSLVQISPSDEFQGGFVPPLCGWVCTSIGQRRNLISKNGSLSRETCRQVIAEVMPCIEKLRDAGLWLSEDLVEIVRQQAGE